MPRRPARANDAMPDAAVLKNAQLPLFSLRGHPRNYNRHPGEQLEKLKASLRRYSQVRSVVVQDDGRGGYVLVAGHGIYEAARQLGFETLKADIIPADWPPAQVEGYLLSDNLTAQGSQADELLLAEMLQHQANGDYDLASVGSSRDELDDLLNRLADSALQVSEPRRDDNAPRAALSGADDDGPDLPPEYEVFARADGEQGQTPDDRLAVYKATMLRQIMLVVTQPVYAVALDKLQRICAAEGLETNTDAVLFLLDDYARGRNISDWPVTPVDLPEPAGDEDDDEGDDEGEAGDA